eukprot:scaffold1996_cov127-Cylindrotheca_fusiformis.AAC.5
MGQSQQNTAGSTFNIVDQSIPLAALREREGRCASCGIQTHHLVPGPFSSNWKTPLTIRNEVHRGRCLLCHPFPKGQEDCKRLDDYRSASYDHSQYSGANYEASEIPSFLWLLQNSSDNEISQFIGCRALWILSWDDEYSSFIGRNGGIPLILSAMIKFPENASIQLCACGALENLACDSDNSSQILKSNGIWLLCQILIRYETNNKMVALYAQRTLHALLSHSLTI